MVIWTLLPCRQIVVCGLLSAGQLLDSIGGHVNPLQLVQQIPPGMAIPALRDRLVRLAIVNYFDLSARCCDFCCPSRLCHCCRVCVFIMHAGL
jgi:hypothetical protein